MVIIIVAAVGFFSLGGGQRLVFEIEDSPTFYIVGEDFYGSYNSNKLEALFFSAQQRSAELETSLVVLNYKSDTLSEGKIHQLIGIMSDQMPAEGDTSNVMVMGQGKYLTTMINAHNLVMPKPEEVREQATEFASKQNLRPDDLSIEIYKNERDLRIMFPLRALN